MNKLPPSIPTTNHPDDIIGGYRELIERHFQSTYRPFNGDFDRAAKKFSHDERKTVSRIYAEMRDNGFYPIGFGEHGGIKWDYRTTLDKHKEEEERGYAAAKTPKAALDMLRSILTHVRVPGDESGEEMF